VAGGAVRRPLLRQPRQRCAARTHTRNGYKPKVRLRVLELQAQVAAQSITAAALTFDAHMQKLEEVRDDARQRGQLSTAIQAEVKRGELRRFYVKQVETGDAGEFERMSTEELRAYVNGEKLPAKDPVKR
jgi:hypothetical protein